MAEENRNTQFGAQVASEWNADSDLRTTQFGAQVASEWNVDSDLRVTQFGAQVASLNDIPPPPTGYDTGDTGFPTGGTGYAPPFVKPRRRFTIINY
jgi:hypothetical protein